MDINMPELRGAAQELGIDLEDLLPAIEDAILGAYTKVPGAIRGAHVEIDRRSGHMAVLAPEVDEEDQPTGEFFDDTPDDFGRIAQATARSVIVQRIQDRRDFEVLGAFKDKAGELISGTVEQGRDPRIVYVRLDEEHEGIMPPHEQVPGERYRHGDRIRAYVTEVSRGPKGAQIILSRTHPGLVRKLFEREVPELVSGDVEIMAVAREAGHRTKMAVRSRQRGLGAKGACIGPMGQRVRAVMAELGGEKIDIVDYSDEPARFIANALSPARVSSVHIQSMEDQTAKAVVPDFQLSLAIGKEGQNARLAARLTGWKIDIHADAETGEVIAGRGSRADDVTGPSAAQRDA
ncbi:MAG: transcription termination factor NusA [Actinomyces urogenitalis]|jgi:N utilization substance protein A|uniref:Transcription termination/antitermination protein NusA n=1 Tax=Actinomyces urogenitalis TaxID=103621 RepID=A0A2I1KTR6_9ACTO|nr:transcription termination factor NusA [Actinomyces urogenitalis]KGE98962.1 transcription elongation factor NusA [Actinomyces urogenitalis S6-C4]MBS5977107.1 transcription termination/antitermination protein NusA [Actinomyces urogenitalis]MDK8236927.1 transcription termination factor NusA [Actinomyces urogenitalis]MDK8835164.1 transcription termination factor NusA [Actinomyces urogenitalis]MDU0864542.1 transcription termination factor NusA [Actinomyces urogenitalis]